MQLSHSHTNTMVIVQKQICIAREENTGPKTNLYSNRFQQRYQKIMFQKQMFLFNTTFSKNGAEKVEVPMQKNEYCRKKKKKCEMNQRSLYEMSNQ